VGVAFPFFNHLIIISVDTGVVVFKGCYMNFTFAFLIVPETPFTTKAASTSPIFVIVVTEATTV
jgi:hypothetical protein